jgi:lysophospholipase L1-like esterase
MRTRSAAGIRSMRSLRHLLPLLSLKAAFVLGACLSSSCTTNGAAPRPSTEATRDGGTLVGSEGELSTGTAKPIVTDATEPTDTPAVQLIGRFDQRDSAGPKCSWPGCRVRARFEGTSVSARLNEIDESWMQGAPSEWDVAIDGALRPKLVTTPGEKTYELATDLSAGEHLVELYKRSEAQNGTTQFLGFDFGGGKLLAPPARSSRRLEVIGDSAAAGFGVEGVGHGPKCPGYNWSAHWQNFHKSFGAVLGETLDAEVFGTVYSGKGMAKNIWHPDKETMPVIFPRSNPNDPQSTWNFASYVPDVVIIMMGGNDFAVGQPNDEGPATLEQFTDAYEGLVVTIRGKYPDAHVFLVTSPSVTDAEPGGRSSRSKVKSGIAAVIARRADAGDSGDRKLHSIEPPVSPKSELTGCDGHGSPEYHQRIASVLAPVVREKAGW